jgi:hypothetical protein
LLKLKSATVDIGSWKRIVITAVAVWLLPATASLQVRQRRSLIDSSNENRWQQVTVTVIARGSHVADSTGNEDIYLVLLSRHKNREPVPARLIHNYAGFERGPSDEDIRSNPRFRLYVTEETYCGMDATVFVASRVFDTDAMAKIHGYLDCFVVRR